MGKRRILDEAGDLVHGPRQATYGHPFDDFSRVGRVWGAILGLPDIPPAKVALMLAGLKLSRESQEHKRDNLVDLAGYAETAALVQEREADREVVRIVADTSRFEAEMRRAVVHTQGFAGLAKPGGCTRSGRPHEGPHDPECWAVKLRPVPPGPNVRGDYPPAPGDYSRPKP